MEGSEMSRGATTQQSFLTGGRERESVSQVSLGDSNPVVKQFKGLV